MKAAGRSSQAGCPLCQKGTIASGPRSPEALKKIGGGMALGLSTGVLIGHEPTAHAQGVAYASWIHGHTVHVQDMSRVRRLTPYGFYAEIDPNPGTFNWVHFGIHTPVILNDQRLRIVKVMLNFATASVDSCVSRVHVYDGPSKIASFDGLLLSGDHPFESFVIPGTPSVGFGIGISIEIAAGVESFDHKFFFRTVGADFVV